MIHVPGLRGNPARSYPVTAVGHAYPGPFQDYVASILAHWEQEKQDGPRRAVAEDLAVLGLTWKVSAKQLTDTEVEIKVGRLRHPRQGGAMDLVSIADVGFGVSQVLPVVVALHAARPGQLVYIEQPEIHLHPSAQVAMAGILARAARRGLRVVIETHSSLLLLALQTLVAEGDLPSGLVRLHWFERDEEGVTRVTSALLDDAGAFGDWPEDFGNVELQAQDAYLTAASKKVRRR